MNNSKFSQLLKKVEVEYDGDLAIIKIQEDGFLIDVYMWNDDKELQIEELNVYLTAYQKNALKNKIIKHTQKVHDENEIEDAHSECGFTQDDYLHFESLIHA